MLHVHPAQKQRFGLGRCVLGFEAEAMLGAWELELLADPETPISVNEGIYP